MTEREQPKREEFSFDEDAFEVEQNIEGAQFLFGDKTFIVKKAQGFSRKDNEPKPYNMVFTEPVGVLVGIPYRGPKGGGVLPLITTHDGSGILLREGEIVTAEGSRQKIKNAQAIAREMELERGDVKGITIEDPYTKIFRLM